MATRPLAERAQAWSQCLLWLVLAAVFLAIGLQKFTAYEAEAVAPMVGHSPFLGWLYPLLGERGASHLFGVIELVTAGGLALGAWRPGATYALIGATLAAITAFITTTFVATSPGAFVIQDGVPLLSLEVGQLFFKDLVLLAVALRLLAEGWRQAQARPYASARLPPQL